MLDFRAYKHTAERASNRPFGCPNMSDPEGHAGYGASWPPNNVIGFPYQGETDTLALKRRVSRLEKLAKGYKKKYNELRKRPCDIIDL